MRRSGTRRHHAKCTIFAIKRTDPRPPRKPDKRASLVRYQPTADDRSVETGLVRDELEVTRICVWNVKLHKTLFLREGSLLFGVSDEQT